jgi:hypothetical protein
MEDHRCGNRVEDPSSIDQPVASIGALAVALSNPNVIFAGTGETDIRSDLASGAGVYKSIDGGTTWTYVGLKDTRQIAKIAIDPANPDVVYVAALGHAYGPNAERGVYKSSRRRSHVEAHARQRGRCRRG